MFDFVGCLLVSLTLYIQMSVHLFFANPIRVSLGFISLEEDSYDWDKSSPYECGFVRPKIPGDFSSRFFHLVILFLV